MSKKNRRRKVFRKWGSETLSSKCPYWRSEEAQKRRFIHVDLGGGVSFSEADLLMMLALRANGPLSAGGFVKNCEELMNLTGSEDLVMPLFRPNSPNPGDRINFCVLDVPPLEALYDRVLEAIEAWEHMQETIPEGEKPE